MSFTYEATGGFKIRGCASPVSYTNLIPYKFGIGQIAYSKAQAKRGKLERVAIKDAVLLDYQRSQSYQGYEEFRFRYKDTFNDIWFDEDLCWQDEAVELATIYWEGVAAMTLNELEEEGCA